MRETPRRHSFDSDNRAPKLHEIARIAAAAIPKSPALMATMAGATLLYVMIGAVYFEQLWLVQERGYDRDEIARIIGGVVIVSGVIGTFIGGIGSDLFTKKTGLGRPMFLFLVMLLCAPFLTAFRLAPDQSI